jgi:murein DD-endopeptidase MepM/ murein hydrolase activator NlpD
MLLTLSALLFLLVSPASARDVVKGQTALISFAKIPPNSNVVFENKTVPLLAFPNHPDKKFVLVPVPYRTAPGNETLFIRYPGGEKKVSLRIENGHYRSETISVAPAKVNPDPKQKKRTKAEYAEAMKIYNSVTPSRYWHAPFIAPMSSPITSPFGTARLYNGSLKSFHSGTDFKAAPGTEVIAANDGVVALAKDRYYAGNSVIIDHGEGLYTCYYHLSRIDVKRGQKIKRGQHLGLSGATGRVTGPHLHFAAMLYGVQVDPLQLIAQVNSLFEQPAK